MRDPTSVCREHLRKTSDINLWSLENHQRKRHVIHKKIMTKLIVAVGGGSVVKSTHIRQLTTTCNSSFKGSNVSGRYRQWHIHGYKIGKNIFLPIRRKGCEKRELSLKW